MIDSRIADAFLKANGFPLEAHLLISGTVGSESHGTRIPPTDTYGFDDRDYELVVAPPPHRLFGLKSPFETWTLQQDELDVVVHSATKWIRLLLKGNPNVLCLLWLRDQDYQLRHPLTERLFQQRDCVLSKQIYHTFAGYAHAQIQRIERLSYERGEGKGGRKAYMGEKRRALVDQFGYDVKYASHAIRLLRMGVEALMTGQLKVYRACDRDELIAIKRGEWSLERVKEEATRLQLRLQEAYDLSPLREEPLAGTAESLLMEMLWGNWAERGWLPRRFFTQEAPHGA